MAEIVDQLRLDISQALRDIDQLETAIDRALGSVEIAIDTTQAQQQLDTLARHADQALGDVDIDFDSGSASNLNKELAGVERNLAGADREADQLAGSLREADRAADRAEKSTRGLAGGFAAIGSSLGGLALAAGAFVAVRGAITFAIDAKDAFAELQDSANAVKVVFGDAVGPIEAFGESVAQSAGLSTAEFNQSASILGGALLNVGFGADEAAKRTIELTQRAADMASVFGGPVSEALGAIQSALRGETDPIERFSVSLSEAAVKAQAAALGFTAVGGEFSTSEKAAARLDLIMQQTARTAGDFANTSDDLANAQKTLTGQFENAKAKLGEALLPVFQSLLDIAPGLIDSLTDLAPSLQGLAVSFGNLITAKEGALDLVDVLNLLVDLPRGFGQLGTTIEAIGLGLGTIGRTAAAVFSAPFTGKTVAETWAEGMERGVELGQESLERINTQGLIDDLRGGADAASALANRLAHVGREGKLSPDFIRDLTTIAGTDLNETVASLEALVGRGQELGLTEDEIRNVAVALAQLQSGGESSEAERALDRTAIALGEVGTAAGEAEVPFGFFVDTVANETARLATFTGRIQEASSGIAEALDPFSEAEERIEVSAQQFFENLVDQVEQQAEFQGNIARLIAAGFDDVAREIGEAGPGANRAAEQFLNNFDLAEKAESLLDGEGTAIAQQIGSELAAELSGSDLTQRQQQAFIELMEAGIFSNSQVQQAIQAGTLGTAQEIAAGVEREFGGVDFNIEIDLSEAGADSRASFFRGLNDEQPGEVSNLRESITNTVDSAIFRDSPPKLFLDIGLESGEAFWMGFEQAELSLRVPVPSVTGSVGSIEGVGVSGGDAFTFAPTYVNTETRDLETVVARSEQTMAAVSGLLGKVKLV